MYPLCLCVSACKVGRDKVFSDGFHLLRQLQDIDAGHGNTAELYLFNDFRGGSQASVIVNLDRYPALGFTAHHFRKIRHGLGGGMILRHGLRQPQDYGLAPGKGRTLRSAVKNAAGKKDGCRHKNRCQGLCQGC